MASFLERELFECGVQLPFEPPDQAQAKELGGLVSGQLTEAKLVHPLEQRVDREAPLEDEVAVATIAVSSVSMDLRD